MTMTPWLKPGQILDSGAQRLRDAHYRRIVVRCDHMFGVLFVIQWIACIAWAWLRSPYTWVGSQSHIHPHVWAALILGGTIISFPLAMILARPGTSLTRHVVAVAQMLFSALLIHVSGGRIETHFHVFGSLAFLAFYRDWRVLVSATVVVAVDHFLRGMFWPESVFGLATASHWRWVEHAAWVIFEDIFLFMACVQGQSELTEISRRQDAAERANSAKSEFVARMSHEIRTPLNGVVGMLDLLRATELSESQQRYARLSREAADALLCVINDILDFSKMEAGKVEIESVEFDLPRIIEDLMELIGPLALKKNLTLESLIHPDVPTRLIGDPNRIRQILTNLLNNALKFTSAGSVSVRVSVEEQDSIFARIRVEVQDSGVGIPREKRDRLFKSFSQVDASTTRKFGGTGLGLAISKRLVELMGGEIGVHSEEGRGATFWFTLKLGAAPAGARSKNEAPSSNCLAVPADSLRGLHFLVAEDNELNQFLTEEILRHAGCTCDIVGDGALAVEAAKKGKYAAILMDCQMPETDGLEASQRIRAWEHQTGTPRMFIIALTADALQGDKDKCLAAGMDGYVTKPIDSQELFATIRSVIARKNQPSTPARSAGRATDGQDAPIAA